MALCHGQSFHRFSNLNESLFYFKICLFTHLLYFAFLTLFVYGFSNVSFKPANVVSCHELNEPNEAGDDEVDDYKQETEEPEYVAEEFLQFENQHKLNLKETEAINLGYQECVKEVNISVHLNESQRKGLIHLLIEYIDMFVWEVSDMLWISTNMVTHKLPINPRFSPVKQKTQKFKLELSLKIK